VTVVPGSVAGSLVPAVAASVGGGLVRALLGWWSLTRGLGTLPVGVVHLVVVVVFHLVPEA
jgi:hypothetical protein